MDNFHISPWYKVTACTYEHKQTNMKMSEALPMV